MHGDRSAAIRAPYPISPDEFWNGVVGGKRLVRDLAAIDAVLQQQIERAARKRLAARETSVAKCWSCFFMGASSVRSQSN